MKTSPLARKEKAILVRLSPLEHRQVNAAALRRGVTTADYVRTLIRVASGGFPAPERFTESPQSR
jgi:hypothetical protein